MPDLLMGISRFALALVVFFALLAAIGLSMVLKTSIWRKGRWVGPWLREWVEDYDSAVKLGATYDPREADPDSTQPNLRHAILGPLPETRNASMLQDELERREAFLALQASQRARLENLLLFEEAVIRWFKKEHSPAWKFWRLVEVSFEDGFWSTNLNPVLNFQEYKLWTCGHELTQVSLTITISGWDLYVSTKNDAYFETIYDLAKSSDKFWVTGVMRVG